VYLDGGISRISCKITEGKKYCILFVWISDIAMEVRFTLELDQLGAVADYGVVGIENWNSKD